MATAWLCVSFAHFLQYLKLYPKTQRSLCNLPLSMTKDKSNIQFWDIINQYFMSSPFKIVHFQMFGKINTVGNSKGAYSQNLKGCEAINSHI